jgi:hypothetical protein
MRPALIVAIAALCAGCSSSAEHTNPVRPTTTVRSTTVAPSAVTAATTTTTTQPVTTGNSYQVGSFSRSGPWSAAVTDERAPFKWRAYRSFDGRQWVALPPAPALPRFVDALHGWALGLDPKHPDVDNRMLWSTRDGGLHYEPLGTMFSGFHHAGDVGEVQFVDRTHGFATSSTLVASGWSVRRTSDGGRTWQTRSSSEQRGAPFGPPAEFEFISATEGYASGYTLDLPPHSADLFRTVDGGSSWQRVGPVITGQHGAGLPTIIDDFVLVPILRVEPSGSRIELYEGTRDDIERPWRGVWSIDVDVRAPISWPGPMQPKAALNTEDDGLVALWHKVFIGIRHDQRVVSEPPSDSVHAVSASGSVVFAESYDDGVFVTSDQGETWERIELPGE